MTKNSEGARKKQESSSSGDEVLIVSKHRKKMERLGRYELVRQLGRGGMARVYLARAGGRGGFHKWLAIKRIHPHLAEEQRFVNMFLDEARIAAAVQHTNVGQVFELGEDEGELYLVMEYLHGEHLGSVWAAARQKLGHLPYRLAASIVASAARGLHHAHESKDASGNPLALIHRDVTPHNIFVTYGGEVKVTDFGVAKATGRITETESGGIKGKWAYMAPEQVLQEEVDRRTDIFALGIVAWELTTGERLFKSESEMHTGMRITSGYVVAPSTIVSDIPESLERIITRALARRPEDRYQSAGDMVIELERCIEGELGGSARVSRELSSVMKELFSERIETREAELEELAGSGLSGPPSSLDSVEQHTDDESMVTVRDEAVEVKQGPPTRRVGMLALIALVIIVVGVAIGVVMVGPETSPSAGVEVRITSRPEGARVSIDGEAQNGRTPLVLSDVSSGTHRIALELDGHQPFTESLVVRDRPMDLVYQMRPAETEPQRAEPQITPPQEGAGDLRRPATKHQKVRPEPADTPVKPPKAPSTTTERRRQPTTSAERTPAFLNLSSRPWSTVTINGQPVGETPIVHHEVSPGRLVIRFSKQGQGPVRTIRITARSGRTISRRVEFDSE